MERITKINDDYLLKYSPKSMEDWALLCKKDMPYANLPVEVKELTEQEKEKYPYQKSKIILPFYKEHKDFVEESFTKRLNTQDILALFNKNLSFLKDMHSKGVCFVDLHPKNLMLDSNFDIKFVDYDSSIVDGRYIDGIPIPHDCNNVKEMEDYFKMKDKLALFTIYLNYLCMGSFKPNDHLKIFMMSAGFDEETMMRILSLYDNDNVIKPDYYFEDIIGKLVFRQYESPKLAMRRYI